MNKCCCLILNYNDSETTIKLVKNIYNYTNINYILVVDNNSTDNSFSELKIYSNSKIKVIKTDKNGGYGYGNNYGIKYAYKKLGCNEILLANPDVFFTESFITSLQNVMRKDCNIAVVSGIQHNINNEEITDKAWKIPETFRYIFTFTGKGMKLAGTHYPESFFKKNNIVTVDCVPGALLLVNAGIFEKIGGYDEEMFLYCEEDVLGYKVKNCGYKTILICNVSYRHEHGVSINKSFKSSIKQRKLINHNKLLFMKRYLNANFIEMMAGRIISIFDLIIIWIKNFK